MTEPTYIDTEPIFEIDEFGTKKWRLNGLLHRKDGPAIEWADESKFWFLNGKCHREDGPAIEHSDGSKSWYLNYKLHREDGPAIERDDGTKAWYLNDELIAKGERPENWDELVLLAQIERVMND